MNENALAARWKTRAHASAAERLRRGGGGFATAGALKIDAF